MVLWEHALSKTLMATLSLSLNSPFAPQEVAARPGFPGVLQCTALSYPVAHALRPLPRGGPKSSLASKGRQSSHGPLPPCFLVMCFFVFVFWIAVYF